MKCSIQLYPSHDGIVPSNPIHTEIISENKYSTELILEDTSHVILQFSIPKKTAYRLIRYNLWYSMKVIVWAYTSQNYLIPVKPSRICFISDDPRHIENISVETIFSVTHHSSFQKVSDNIIWTNTSQYTEKKFQSKPQNNNHKSSHENSQQVNFGGGDLGVIGANGAEARGISCGVPETGDEVEGKNSEGWFVA